MSEDLYSLYPWFGGASASTTSVKLVHARVENSLQDLSTWIVTKFMRKVLKSSQMMD